MAEVAGLDPYSVLIRGAEAEKAQDHKTLVAEVVKRAHERALAQINDSFAKTMIGGKVAVIREFTDPSFGTPTYAVMAPPQLKEWYRGIEAYKAVDGEAKRTNLGQDWLDWLGQRRYRAMTFMPGQVAPDIYNGWAGFPIPPVEGDWSLMKRLILEGLCDGNEVHYNWLMDWMAPGLQKPAARYGVAAVLRGEKGVGKGEFAKWYGKLFGNHFMHLSNLQHLCSIGGWAVCCHPLRSSAPGSMGNRSGSTFYHRWRRLDQSSFEPAGSTSTSTSTSTSRKRRN